MIPSEPAFFLTIPAASTEYARIGCTTLLNFVGVADHSNFADARLPRDQRLNPQGMSGGGIFSFGTMDQLIAGNADTRLVGITTHYYEERHLFVAANTVAVIDMLRLFGATHV